MVTCIKREGSRLCTDGLLGPFSFTSWALPPSERHHLEEMERVNNLIQDVENAVHLRETLKVMEKSE